jgi:hypothetical protein
MLEDRRKIIETVDLENRLRRDVKSGISLPESERKGAN